MASTPALLGALGLVGLVFGLLSFVLFLFGAPTDLFWILANLVGGGALLVVSVFMSLDTLRERMRSGEARRAGKYGSSAVATALLSLAIVGLLSFLATRYPVRFDWSEAGVHSLSDQTTKVLSALETDVEVIAFYSPLDAMPVRELLDRYTYVSDRFQVSFADPTERPDLIERYAVSPDRLNPGLVRIAIGDEAVEVEEVTEEKLTNAMVKLTRTGSKRVYFLIGHNERAVEGEAASAKEGYGRAAAALRNENYQVSTLLLAAEGAVPEDADVVVVPGPTRPLLEVERSALGRYLAGGGAVMALVDPRAQTDLVEDIAAWGIELGEDIVVDRALALFGRATTPFASSYDPEHEISKDLRETTLFHVVRSVQARADGPEGAEFTELVFTGESSWAERDLERFFEEGTAELDDGDLPGPVSVAVVGTPAVPAADREAGADGAADPPRVAVFGDSDFASNEFVETYRNRDLFVNTVNWLLGDVEAISIRPNLSRASRFQLSTEQFTRIRTLSLFILPEALAVLGVLRWWRRRRSSGI